MIHELIFADLRRRESSQIVLPQRFSVINIDASVIPRVKTYLLVTPQVIKYFSQSTLAVQHQSEAQAREVDDPRSVHRRLSTRRLNTIQLFQSGQARGEILNPYYEPAPAAAGE